MSFTRRCFDGDDHERWPIQDFLEGLANPVPLRDTADVDDADDLTKGEARVTTTPLVEYLKEKKANKLKDSSSGKKRGEAKNKGKIGRAHV